MLSQLSAELILQITRCLDKGALNSLTQTNHDLYNMLNPLLYQRNVREDDGTALMWACRHSGLVGTAKLAVVAGAEVNVSANDQSRSCLYNACGGGHLEVCRFLLDLAGDEVSREMAKNNGRGGVVLLRAAAMGGSAAIVRMLLARGADPSKPDTDNDGLTAYHVAAEFGRLDILTLLEEDPRVNVGADTDRGECAFHLAARGLASNETLAHLLQVVRPTHSDLMDCFLRAARAGQLSRIKFLLDRGLVDVNDSSSVGQSALVDAVRHGRDEVVEYLLATPGIEVNTRRHLGNTPLMAAASRGRVSIMRLLLTLGKADLRIRDSSKRTVLFHAVKCRESIQPLQFLMDEHPEFVAEVIGDRDVSGRSVLASAVYNGKTDALQTLLAMDKVNVNARDVKRLTPLDYAIKNGSDAAVIQLLMDHGAHASINSPEENAS